MDFDREVNKIGRRRALAFFGKRLLVGAVILYFAIAAYGRFHAKPATCACDDCKGECYDERIVR